MPSSSVLPLPKLSASLTKRLASVVQIPFSLLANCRNLDETFVCTSFYSSFYTTLIYIVFGTFWAPTTSLLGYSPSLASYCPPGKIHSLKRDKDACVVLAFD